jgi:seipin
LFYWYYIPRIGFERTVWLQFDDVYSASGADAHPYPYGVATLTPDLVGAQRYDVVVELLLPRTVNNTEAGNFMVEVKMFGPDDAGSTRGLEDLEGSIETGGHALRQANGGRKVLARSRRPAILPYRSWLVEQAFKFTEFHWYLLNFRQESETLRLSVFEGISFPRGWRNVPSSLQLEIQSSTRLQIYAAKALFRARFRGLRWLMYNHRIISALIFIPGFWTTEMLFAGLAWAFVSMTIAPRTPSAKAEAIDEVASNIKQEEDTGTGQPTPRLSDTERTFPSAASQQPIRYRSPSIKQEDDGSMVMVPGEPVTPAAEADDEEDEEDADFFLDSGIGTSMESGSASRRENIRRRRGRLSLKTEG